MGEAAESKHTYSYSEYLEWEKQQVLRYEYYQGEVFARAGSTDTHNEIILNTSLALRGKAREKGCKVYAENVRLEIQAGAYYTYPDVMLTCDEKDHQERLLKRHPQVIVEVLSESTEKYDRGFKWLHYKRIPSLRYYLLISQYVHRVEVFSRDSEEAALWHFRVFESLADVIDLRQLGGQISLKEIYEGVSLETSEDRPPLSRS
ncbi:MAG: Uma2 family endonuclease [Bacteroidota bacterium]